MPEDEQKRWNIPAEVVYADSAMVELDTGVLEDFEARTGYTVFGTLPQGQDRGEAKALRATLWLAIRAIGRDLDWESFTPKLLKYKVEQVPDIPLEPVNRAERRAAKRAPTKRTPRRSGTSSATTDPSSP